MAKHTFGFVDTVDTLHLRTFEFKSPARAHYHPTIYAILMPRIDQYQLLQTAVQHVYTEDAAAVLSVQLP